MEFIYIAENQKSSQSEAQAIAYCYRLVGFPQKGVNYKIK